MTTIIVVAYEVPKEKIQKIEEHLEHVSQNNIDWNGAEFQIQRGDFTCIENNGSEDAVILLNAIYDIIQ